MVTNVESAWGAPCDATKECGSLPAIGTIFAHQIHVNSNSLRLMAMKLFRGRRNMARYNYYKRVLECAGSRRCRLRSCYSGVTILFPHKPSIVQVRRELTPSLKELLGVDALWCDTRTEAAAQRFVLWAGYVLEVCHIRLAGHST